MTHKHTQKYTYSQTSTYKCRNIRKSTYNLYKPVLIKFIYIYSYFPFIVELISFGDCNIMLLSFSFSLINIVFGIGGDQKYRNIYYVMLNILPKHYTLLTIHLINNVILF